MPDAKKPECVIVITKGNKEIDLKQDDEIIQINDKQNPRKSDLGKALRESEGKEINFHIKNENGVTVKKIKPVNKNEGKKIKKKYDLGIKYFEREIHPLIDKLKKKYSLIK
jgi:PDZ domain-containing secreted protein